MIKLGRSSSRLSVRFGCQLKRHNTIDQGILSNVHQRIAGRTRFYKTVDVCPVDSGDKEMFKVLLDGRNLRTPGRNELHLPTLELAGAIAAEWDAQTDARNGIQPATMPLMILASTAIDQVLPNPEPTRQTCIRYLPTDTALVWTHDEDRILLKKQRDQFGPLVGWMAEKFDVHLSTTQSLAARIAHPEGTLARVANMISKLDHFSLTCLQCATMESKSLLLGIALLAGEISLEDAKSASRLEEEFQLEVWGLVEGGHDMDRLNNAVSLSSVVAMMSLLHGPDHAQTLQDTWREAAVERAPLR